jgi:methenyltetrahydromethanopterin cyclohydrolase
MTFVPSLNLRAARLADEIAQRADELRVEVHTAENGTRLLDCGAKTVGSMEAGRFLAQVCLAGLGRVEFVPGRSELGGGLAVAVTIDQPVAACMAAQYAGWQISGDKYFAMGSGPMRAAGSREPLFDEIGYRERPDRVVGVLETSKLPPAAVCAQIAAACGVTGEQLTLCIARTASLAGTVQVVARSVETALHKMHALGFDLSSVVSGFGVAPLPPVAHDDMAGIGRTNDAILYGGEVTLWLRDDDARLVELGRQIPSSSSADYGEPFAAIFERYDRDFYKIDSLLFSPACITLVNLASGRQFRFGQTNPAVLERSCMPPVA